MLRQAMERVQSAGYAVANIDCIVFAQRPKLSNHKLAIRQQIADILQLDVTNVSVKAKTGEHVGPIGREEAISAECVALLQPLE
jgi:2-C-methyl-D-erythritol 2,4-cyclodiphosphate synthase